MESVREKYGHLLRKMMSKVRRKDRVSDDEVYLEGQADLLEHIDSIIKEQLLPGSGINGFGNLEALMDAARAGESCLLLFEHYSNFDLPGFHYFLREKGGRGPEIAAALVAIAGIKLDEENPIVAAFTNAYSRIVIYPSRSLEIIKRNLKDPNRLVVEMMRSSTINRAAMKTLAEKKKEGKLVLVFPAGTRYRPWDPETKKGVREISSYIKSFSKFCLVAVNGNIFRLSPDGDMSEDILCNDVLVYTVGPVRDSGEFLDHVKQEHHFREDRKQAIVDHVMEDLDEMHREVEKTRT